MDALEVARAVAGELDKDGALAVVLAGSHARDEASDRSDLDLYAIGAGPGYQLQVQHGMLVSISWRSIKDEQTAFRNPALAGGAVPGWRSAMILLDPQGVAAKLKERARCWTWDEIGDERINAWVVEELTGYAEEVHKLITALEHGNLFMAAVQRSVIALRVPVILATHLRLLYDSENVLWDLVAASAGSDWTEAQATAFGRNGESFRETCIASLNLYAFACDRVAVLFNTRQQEVVSSAITAVESVR